VSLYLTADLTLIPAGTMCRIFGQIHDGRTVVELQEDLTISGLGPWDGMQGNGIPIGIDDKTPGKFEPWEDKEGKEIDARIDKAVDEIAALSFAYPSKVSAKLKGKVDLPTTEGLLSADGKPVKLEAPQGWKVGG